MCAAKNPTQDEDGKDDPTEKPPTSLPLPLLLALLSGGSGLPGLPELPQSSNKAERIKRHELASKYGQKAGRFRETTGNIAAIDFGTTFCSLAFTVNAGSADTTGRSQSSTLKLNEVFSRVPTAILLRQMDNSVSVSSGDGLVRTPKYEVAKFGYDAQTEHKTMRKEERARSLYFERFKMDLQKDMNVSRNMVIKASNGTEYYLVEVIAYVLQYLKDCLKKKLSEPGNDHSEISINDFDWVLTVPAIWRSRGKRMMREAAYLAGLCSSDVSINRFIEVGKGIPRSDEANPDRLTIALEPEAAAIYCQTMKAEEIQAQCRFSGSLRSEHYVVIDIGGGTVDITAHHHDNEKGIEVITEPIGNDCGGMKVNYEFSKLMQKILGDSMTDQHKFGYSRFLTSPDPTVAASRKAVVNFLIHKEFEEQKAIFGSSCTGRTREVDEKELSIKIPYEMSSFYGPDKIEEGVESLNDDRIQLEEDLLFIKYSKMREIFQPAVDGILKSVSLVLEKAGQSIDTIYLVGGFGGCSFIFNQISTFLDERKSKIRVIVPKDHNLAVAQGAVKYRLNPDIIHSRVMDASYGTDIAAPFNPNVHDRKYYIGIDSRGIPRRQNVFFHYVERGEAISSDEIVTAELSPLSDAAEKMHIDLYSTYEKDVEYIKDENEKPVPGVRKVGEIQIDMPNEGNLPRELRGVEMTMDFSHTEIQVRARYTVNNAEVKATIDFLSDQA